MSKSKMDNQEQEQIITTFLEELPQAPLPPLFLTQVMQQITPSVSPPQWAPPRFRLGAMDILLPAFATVFSVLLYWLIQQDLGQLPQMLPTLLTDFEPLSFDTNWLYVGVVLAVGELTFLLGIAWFWMEDQPLLSFEW